MAIRLFGPGAEYQQPYVRVMRLNGATIPMAVAQPAVDATADNVFTVSVNPTTGAAVNAIVADIATGAELATGDVEVATLGTTGNLRTVKIKANKLTSGGTPYVLRITLVISGTTTSAACEVELTTF